jgi:cardiolipin synthase A/B
LRLRQVAQLGLSLNWDTKNLTGTRDYATVTRHAHEGGEISVCFEADWSRTPFKPGSHSHLILRGDNGRARIAPFIDDVKRTLFLQNERYQGPVIIERLVRARERG